MSEDVSSISAKAKKKALRDAQRKRVNGKPKRHKGSEAVEENDAMEYDGTRRSQDPADEESSLSTSRYDKHSTRKRKTSEDETEQIKEEKNPKSAKPKKRRKIESTGEGGAEENRLSPSTTDRRHRFVLFIGNLPYNTTDAALQAHFRKLEPFTLRHRTDPKTKKSKGFAFLEFEHYDRMKTCIKLYHHSVLDPDDPTTDVEVHDQGDPQPVTESMKYRNSRRRSTARKINVELTAGGGGKAENRKEKIKTKNVRLEEQRKRRAELQRKEKMKKDRLGTGAESKEPGKGIEISKPDTSDIHPSRLSRVQQ